MLKDFNQLFTTILNKIAISSKHVHNVQVEFQNVALPLPIDIFVKKSRKSMTGNFDETNKIGKKEIIN
jgi:hypothetical protein